jgi:UDP-MurNAc hydroxylase
MISSAIPSNDLKIHLLNHASIIIEIGSIKLLTDPWYWGTCFENGWGLRYSNENALTEAATCTHLWISHPHSDHLHLPTLKELCNKNPNIVCIGNRSFNFHVDQILKDIGFKTVIPFSERTPINLTDDVEITRFPSTGIDNILVLRTKNFTVLNYNDCVLPDVTRQSLASKIGPVDVVLSNFNHAGKLLNYPLPAIDTIKRKLINNFEKNVESFHPRWKIPFASYHYYRSKETLAQNPAMLTLNEITDGNGNLIPLNIGQSVIFSPDKKTLPIYSVIGEIKTNELDVHGPQTSINSEILLKFANQYIQKLRHQFPIVNRFLPPLNIWIYDLKQSLVLETSRGARLTNKPKESHHIEVHSDSLKMWFTRPYGTDAFVVGGHFGFLNEHILPAKWQFILGLLIENKIDIRSIVRMLFSFSGLKFLWNRREEIIGIMKTRKIGSDYHR